MMHRFRTMSLIAWLAMCISLFTAPHRSPAQSGAEAKKVSREDVLRSLVQKVIAPGYTKLAAECTTLTKQIEEFNAAPNQAALERARQTWIAAAAAADSLGGFQFGPIVDREFSSTFYYWQTIPSRIENVVDDPSLAIDQSLIESAGATSKGLYAIENLLFDRPAGLQTEPPESAKALDLLSASKRRREYLIAAAQDMAHKASLVSADWAALGPQSVAEKFITDTQNSINILVNNLTQSLEITYFNHLNFVLMIPSPIEKQLNRVKGSRSNTSLQRVIVALEGVENFYTGAGGVGLRDSLVSVNPTLAARVQEQFKIAIAKTREIAVPLERAAVDKREAVQSAVDQAHALEILFKVDLASSLGVTITFTSGDGD
jgi:uncharacterized protein